MKENGVIGRLASAAAMVLDIRPSTLLPSEQVINIRRIKKEPRVVFDPCAKLPKRKG